MYLTKQLSKTVFKDNSNAFKIVHLYNFFLSILRTVFELNMTFVSQYGLFCRLILDNKQVHYIRIECVQIVLRIISAEQIAFVIVIFYFIKRIANKLNVVCVTMQNCLASILDL